MCFLCNEYERKKQFLQLDRVNILKQNQYYNQ